MSEVAKREFMEMVRLENERKNSVDRAAMEKCQGEQQADLRKQLEKQIQEREAIIAACKAGKLFELEAEESRWERKALHHEMWLDEMNNELKKANESFYKTADWLDLRYRALKRSRGKCELCGADERLHVDHIKPRSKYPKLALRLDNLQVLCADCNLGKSNRDETDWRR